MRTRTLSRNPNKPGTRQIVICDDPFGHDFSRSGKIFKLYVNGQYIARHDDFISAMQHMRNTIYGYGHEIMAY